MRPMIFSLALALVPSLAPAQWVPDGAPVCQAAFSQQNNRICPDGSGGAFLVWEDSRTGSWDSIYAQRVDASGNPLWAVDGVVVFHDPTSGSTYPRVLADGAGGAIVTWLGGFPTGARAAKLDPSGTVLWSVDASALSPGFPVDPEAATDGAGGVIVTWSDLALGGVERILAQRVGAAGGLAWTTGGVILCGASGTKTKPKIASDGSGGAVVTWYDRRNPSYYEVYAQRVSATGAPQWTTDGVLLAPNGAIDPRIVSDGADGAIVAWEDYRGATFDVFAQRLGASGAELWTSGGLAVCGAAQNQEDIALAADGAGGMIAAWRDARSGSDVYAQRVDAAGLPRWTANGVDLSSSFGSKYRPAIASDGAGGAVVTWAETRTVDKDIFVQRVDAAGTLLGAPEADPVCTVAGAQALPQAAFTGAQVIVAWDDFRGAAPYDIYAQNVPLGATSVPVLPATGPSRLRARPNPFTTTTEIVLDGASPGPSRLSVHDVSGRTVRRLAIDRRGAGQATATWDGRDGAGRPLPAGMYFVRFPFDGAPRSAKVLLRR